MQHMGKFSSSDFEPIDLSALFDRCMGDLDRIGETLTMFVEDSAVRLADLEHQLEAGDATAARRTAYALRGSAASLSANQLSTYAEQIESLSRAGDLPAAETYLSMLRDELDKCVCAVPKLLKDARNSGDSRKDAA